MSPSPQADVLAPASGLFADRLRVLVVAAHPDEPDEYVGGTAAKLAQAGHGVKFLSLTNGDAGHRSMPRKALARRRAVEAYAAARELGVQEYEILSAHDGELEASVAMRRKVVARIRRWQADVVVAFHDECPGHLDNRAAGRLVREAVAVVGLANVVPDVPALATPPVCLLMPDHDALAHHRHDVVVDVSSTIEAKLRACAAHASQFLEFAPWQRGLLDQVPPVGDWDRVREFVLEHWSPYLHTQPEMRAAVSAAGLGAVGEFAESFQLAGYGRDTTATEVRALLSRPGIG
ncbi:PIG-L deacetylase family protein [Oerskovia sp. NPDC057915]|uniref:PIG-L deacetylase family protein n=1 Tax=Oerskovia sp. NPDC057915 TaxID=3346280 RepID=UPI0036DE499E